MLLVLLNHRMNRVHAQTKGFLEFLCSCFPGKASISCTADLNHRWIHFHKKVAQRVDSQRATYFLSDLRCVAENVSDSTANSLCVYVGVCVCRLVTQGQSPQHWRWQWSVSVWAPSWFDTEANRSDWNRCERSAACREKNEKKNKVMQWNTRRWKWNHSFITLLIEVASL